MERANLVRRAVVAFLEYGLGAVVVLLDDPEPLYVRADEAVKQLSEWRDPEKRPARVAQQLALAHRIQRAIEVGEIRDQAEAARRLGVTRARVSRLLDLTLLAPVLQERLLYLDSNGDVGPSSERALRTQVGRRARPRQRSDEIEA